MVEQIQVLDPHRGPKSFIVLKQMLKLMMIIRLRYADHIVQTGRIVLRNFFLMHPTVLKTTLCHLRIHYLYTRITLMHTFCTEMPLKG